MRADQIAWANGENRDRPGELIVPIVADAEAGFGGPLNAFELMKQMVAAGAAGVHWEDQLASEKKCGHLGGKVLVPTRQHVRTLNSARLAADVLGVETLIIARTDALAATLLTSDVDPVDAPFCTGERTAGGFLPGRIRARAGAGARQSLRPVRGPDLGRDRHTRSRARPGVRHRAAPGFPRASGWRTTAHRRSTGKRPSATTRSREFQDRLGELGYAFQFITLAGFHALNHSMFSLAKGYATDGMSSYVALQEAEFAAEADGYTATRHQAEVGTGYFDRVTTALNPNSETTALADSTEAAQFH